MKYPVLYAQSLAKTMYKHCQKGYAFYALPLTDETFIQANPLNQAYLDEINEQLYQRVHDKFIAATPLYVTNNQKKFIMFRSNLEPLEVNEFVSMTLDELAFHTGIEFYAKIAVIPTMLMVMDQKPTIFSANKIGDKLSDSELLLENLQIIHSHGWKNDNGFFPEYKEFLKQHGQIVETETDNQEIDDDELLSGL